jgi:hypothetical protein
MPNIGFSLIPPWSSPLLTPEVARARSSLAAERRNRFAAKHPDIKFSQRREGVRLLFEVSEPDLAAWATHDAEAMMDDLEARYPYE